MTTLHILYVEDNPDDVVLVERLIAAQGYLIECVRVETAAAFEEALETGHWDIILADYTLPSFSAVAALAIVKQRALALPVIVISGTIDETMAGELMRAGASDFIRKGSTSRLVPAIEREVREAQASHKHRDLEAQVDEAEQRFARLFHVSPEAVGVIRLSDGQLLEFNRAFSDLLQYSREQLEADAPALLQTVIDPDDVARLLGALERQHPLTNFEFTLHAAGGSERQVLVWADIVTLNGEPCLLAKLFDISDRKRDEAQLAYQANLLQHVSDAIIALDTQWYVRSWNQSAEHIYGWAADEVLGHPLSDFVRTEFLDRTRDDVLREFLETEHIQYEAIQYRCDGTPLYVANTTRALKDASGRVIGAVGVNRDITAFKRAQEAQQAEHAFVQALADVALMLTETLDLKMVLERILDTVGRVVPHDATNIALIEGDTLYFSAWRGYASALDSFFSTQRIHVDEGGFSRMFLTGQPQIVHDTQAFANWVPLPDDPWVRSCLGLPIVVGGSVVGAVNLDSRTSNYFTEAHVERLRVFANYVAIAVQNAQMFEEIRQHASDLEQRIEERTLELRQALAKEHELGELKSRFVTLISHEFRTPLTVIQSSTDLLKHYADRYSPERRAEKLDEIQSQVWHMIGLLEDFLTIARADAGTLKFMPVATELQEFLTGIIGELQRVYDGYPLTFTAKDVCPVTDVDHRLVRQIVTNLVSNAAKYSPAGSSIGIVLACRETEFDIEVQDQGIGIPEEEQAQLYDLFFRASNVGTIPGTGVGLPLIKRAVDAHDGRISVVSSLGRGATFTVTLPMRRSEDTMLTTRNE